MTSIVNDKELPGRVRVQFPECNSQTAKKHLRCCTAKLLNGGQERSLDTIYYLFRDYVL